ncbi:hypothetical protein [Nonomuraea sp. NPDC003214]
MPDFPPGHAFYLAVYIPVSSPAHLRLIEQNPFVTIPDDLTESPEWVGGGMVLEVQQVVCLKCRKPYSQVAFDPECPADSNPYYLRGGKHDRAGRTTAPPGQSGAEVAARQRRENPALMQASRISGLS